MSNNRDAYFNEILNTAPSGRREDNFFKAGPEGRYKKDAKAWFLVKITQVGEFSTRDRVEFLTIEVDVLDSTNDWPWPTAKQWQKKHDDAGKAGIRAFYETLIGEDKFAMLKSEDLSDVEKVQHAQMLKTAMAKVIDDNAAAGLELGVYVHDTTTVEKGNPFSRVTWASAEEAKTEITRYRESPVVQKALAKAAAEKAAARTQEGDSGEIPF